MPSPEPAIMAIQTQAALGEVRVYNVVNATPRRTRAHPSQIAGSQKFHLLTTMKVIRMKMTKGSIHGNQRTPGARFKSSTLATEKKKGCVRISWELNDRDVMNDLP